jgi:hypothetical protein
MIKLNYHRKYVSITPIARFLKDGFLKLIKIKKRWSWNNPGGVRNFLTPDEYYAIHGMKAPGLQKIYVFASFQPFLNMGKDVVDTFKPYKGFYQSTRDFLQPLDGVWNILRGAVLVVLSLGGMMSALYPFLLALIISPLILCFMPSRYVGDALGFYLSMAGIYFSSMNEGTAAFLRGLGQVATTPLTWFIKMPLRGLITLFKGVPKAEESETIVRLAKAGHDMLDVDANPLLGMRTARIINSIHAKFECAVKKGQGTGIFERENEKLNNFLNADTPAEGRFAAREYLNQFALTTESRNFMMFADKQKSELYKKQNGHPDVVALNSDVVGLIGGFFNQATKADAMEYAKRVKAAGY